jgi:sulfur-carrier protein adenylyltransferase/sulfurtransferase
MGPNQTIDASRYARQIALPEVKADGQVRLARYSVLIVGCGGLGCTVAQLLVAAGVGEVGLVDEDSVHLSNLHRQLLFTESNVGMLKVVAATERLKQVNGAVTITPFPLRWKPGEELTDWSRFQVVVDATDNFDTRYAIDQWCFQFKKPLVSASVDAWQGMISVFHASVRTDGKCFSYAGLYPNRPAQTAIGNCESNGVMPTAVFLVGSIQANEVIKLALQDSSILEGKVLVVNLLDLEFYSFILTAKFFHPASSTPTMHSISSEDLNVLFKNNEPLAILDVREGYEVNAINLGGLHLPMNDVPRHVQQISKDVKTIVVCKMGVRSAYVIEFLQREHGYSNLVNLHGGIFDFSKKFPESPKLKRANSPVWPAT